MSLCITITTPEGIVAASDSRANTKYADMVCYNDDSYKVIVMNDVIISHLGNLYINDHTDIRIQQLLEVLKEKYKNRKISVHKWPELILKEVEAAELNDNFRIYKGEKLGKVTEASAVYFTIAGYSSDKSEKDIPFIYIVDTYNKNVERILPDNERKKIYGIVQDGAPARYIKFLNGTKILAYKFNLKRAIDYARLVVTTDIEFNKFYTSEKQSVGGTCRIYAIDRIHGIAGSVDESGKIVPDPEVKTSKRKIV